MVKNIWRSSSKLFARRQNSILSAALVLMMAVLFSRILGLVRDRLLAGSFFLNGNEWQLDVYFAAFRIPDMLFQLLVLGALSAAFIPVYSGYIQKNEKKSWQLVNGVITLACLGFVVLAGGIFIFTEPLSRLIAPNFGNAEIALMVTLTRIMLISQFFFVISNFFTGILQSNQRFLLPAIAPILYNIGIIFGIIFLSPSLGIYGPTMGVVLGALLHLLVQYPLVKQLGFTYTPTLGLHLKGVRQIGKLMIPRTLALAVNQIELTVAVFLASALSAGSLSIFYFSQHLQALPIGLFGLTIGQAALPILSKEGDSEGSNSKFKSLFISSFNNILYFALPASVLLLVLRIPLVRIAFGSKNFPWEATLLTGKVVAAFALSVAAQAVIQILVRAFYALQDTRTPLVVGGLSVAVNVGLSWWLVQGMGLGVVGLGLAISIAGIVQAIILFALLDRRVGRFEYISYIIPILKMFMASVLTGIALWLPMRFLDQFVLDTTRTIQLIILTVVASGCGFMVYVVFSKIFQIEELEQFLSILKKFGAWKSILSESEEVLSEASASPPTTTTEN
ncbi:MAG: murein biosynthesis integral membrane protein MurJ [Patescibacteria group bacterium]|jgi:putative peptidoglycan lipid II flippase